VGHRMKPTRDASPMIIRVHGALQECRNRNMDGQPPLAGGVESAAMLPMISANKTRASAIPPNLHSPPDHGRARFIVEAREIGRKILARRSAAGDTVSIGPRLTARLVT
jgi:hypothetical protein